jgi:hypothetical protein
MARPPNVTNIISPATPAHLQDLVERRHNLQQMLDEQSIQFQIEREYLLQIRETQRTNFSHTVTDLESRFHTLYHGFQFLAEQMHLATRLAPARAKVSNRTSNCASRSCLLWMMRDK